jgi:hypothetical protein
MIFFHISKYKLFLGFKQPKQEIIDQKKGKKINVTLKLNSSLPHVLFGDTVATPAPLLSVTHNLNGPCFNKFIKWGPKKSGFYLRDTKLEQKDLKKLNLARVIWL